MMIINKNSDFKIKESNKGFSFQNSITKTEVIMNDVAMEVWNMLDQVIEFENIVDNITKIYDVNREDAKRDIRDILEKFKRYNLISYDGCSVNEEFAIYKEDGKNILFFPSNRVILEVDDYLVELFKNNNFDGLSDNDANILKECSVINTDSTPDDWTKLKANYPTRIILLPTTDCNLRCKYCYAAAGIEKKKYMSWESAKSAIDYSFENLMRKNRESGENKAFSLGFMGGGEPTLNWDVITKSTEYVRSLGEKFNVRTGVELTTNAILDYNQLEWICNNIDYIKISFDGPRDIQNSQRGSNEIDSFESVCKSIDYFDKHNKDYLIRCTVTSDIVDRMPEILEFYLNRFNLENKSIIFNPVYVCGSCINNNVQSINEKKFAENFMKCQRMVENISTDVVSSYDRLRTGVVPKLPYCGFKKGNCFFTPDGYLSTCSEVDSLKDIRSPFFFFGKYDENSKELIVNEEKLKQLYELGNRKKECNKCSISLFCPGMCLVRGLDLKAVEKYHIPEEEILNPLNDNTIKLIREELGNNYEAHIQCRLNRDISKKEILYAIGLNDNISDKGTFKTEILYRSNSKNEHIKKIIKLSLN